MKFKKLPKFRSPDDMAAFWDTHDLTDYEHLMEQVKGPTFMGRRKRTSKSSRKI